MAKYIIKNYEQVLAHLTALSTKHNKSHNEYLFAVADTFEENLPPASNLGGHIPGMGAFEYQKRLSKETEQLLAESGTDMDLGYLTKIRVVARAWKKEERIYNVAWGVYQALTAHKELIEDGLKVERARALIAQKNHLAAAGDAEQAMQEKRRLRQQVGRIERGFTLAQREAVVTGIASGFNPVRRINIGLSNWRNVLSHIEDVDSDEVRLLIGEGYAVLDAMCERLGISMWDDGQQEAA